MIKFPQITVRVGPGRDDEKAETFQLQATPERQGKSKAWGNLRNLQIKVQTEPLPKYD